MDKFNELWRNSMESTPLTREELDKTWCLSCQHGPPHAVSYFHCPECHYQAIKPGRYGAMDCPHCGAGHVLNPTTYGPPATPSFEARPF